MNAELDLLSHTALKGSAVLLAALFLGIVLHKAAAARRHALWMTAMLALAALPLAMSLLPAWRVLPKKTGEEFSWQKLEHEESRSSSEPVLLPTGTRLSFPSQAIESSPVPASLGESKMSWRISWSQAEKALPVVWLSVVAALLLRLAWSAWRLRRLEHHMQAGTCELLAPTARELGLKRLPQLHIGPQDSVPMVWGVFKPCLLLPAGFEAWPEEKLRSVLRHELAHLKRGDPLALWLSQWVKALHWFNPLAWLTLRQLRADQERACDDNVLRLGTRPSDYAQHLLDLSRHKRLAGGLSLCALTITRCAPVESRIKAILDPHRSREPLTTRWLVGAAFLALVFLLPVAMLQAIEGTKLRGRILDRNGVVLAETTKEKMRHYPLKTLAAHSIGYTRLPDEEHAQIFGGAALEKRHDAELSAGKDVTLTLDMRLQFLAHRAMTEAGVTRGAAVVLDPRTGEVLAAVSLPVYDPNLFIPSITLRYWDLLLKDRDVPLLDRSLRGFSPGSTFMLLTGLAGGAGGVGGQKFICSGSVTYGNTVMQCWKQRRDGSGHGVLGMTEALAASCSCFWHQFGNAAGIEQIESMGHRLGFGNVYGITDQEDKGILPSPSWLTEHRPTEKWSAGYTANTSVGQGMVLASPLQMAVLAATVGNGGKVPQPVIARQDGESSWRTDLTKDAATAAAVVQLREGMRLVVNGDSGTGHAARSDKVVIAGQTGTAQNWRRDSNGKKQEDNHGWFIGFAPFESPTLAFAILKQGAKSGGGDCGPIAKRIVEESLALPADGSGDVKPARDAQGDAWEKAEAQRSAFDAKAATISSAIRKAEPDSKTGFVLSELKISRGKVTLLGEAGGMIQALQFRENLEKIGESFEIEWEFPVPQTMKDGVRVKFQAVGSYRPANSSAADIRKQSDATSKSPSAAQIRQQSDDAIRMRPAAADNWKFLRSKCLLADLPAEAVVPVLSERDRHHSSGFFQFLFSLPRDAARRWLLESLRVKAGHEEEFLNWPERPAAFYRTYSALNDCQITVQCLDGETVRVSLSKQKPRILIAPDEAAPPTPKTAAPKALEGMVCLEVPAPSLQLHLVQIEALLASRSSGDPPLPLPEPDPVLPKWKNPFKQDQTSLHLQLETPRRAVIEDVVPGQSVPFGGKRLDKSLLVTRPENK